MRFDLILFSFFVLSQTSVEKFSQFQSAYWIEKALPVDNLFVFILVFNFFKVKIINFDLQFSITNFNSSVTEAFCRQVKLSNSTLFMYRLKINF